jgi:hypothetical protein
VYDNFESGTLGANIAGNAPVYREIGGSWTWADAYGSDPNYPPKYSNDVTRGPGTRVMRAQYGQPDAYKSGLLINHPLPNSGDAVYFTMWMYYDHTSTDWPDNLKPWDAFDADYLYPAAYFGWGEADVGDGEGRSALQDADQDGDPDSPTLWDSTGIANLRDVEGSWIRMEGYLKQSTPDTPDGVYQIVIHQSDPRIDQVLYSGAIQTRKYSDYLQNWLFGYFHRTNGDAAGSMYFDNLYFDNTRQRLELGNNPVYASCTRREVQPSTAWSDTSITALCQKGAISSGTAYLFVIGADGTASAGIEVDVT